MDDFCPPWLLRNRHLQTLIGHLWSGPPFREPSHKHRVPLGDGDQLVAHDSTPAAWRSGDPIAVLVHGLGGCHDSGHLRRLARLLAPRGVRTVRVDLRGTGDGLPLARKAYHAGCSEDVRAVLEMVHGLAPESPVWLVGVSLGANIVLKLAAEAADRPVPGLQRVLALGPPIDMPRCSVLMARRGNRFYNRYFARILVSQAIQRQRLFPDTPSVQFPRRATLRVFDELYTAPRNGFAGADDYYRRVSSFPLIASIHLPVLILTARDDPFIAVEPFEELRLPACVELHIIPRGGHLGFVGRDHLGGMRWAEAKVVDWLVCGPRTG
jgi:predicted alpha/beta-fold hydrolase